MKVSADLSLSFLQIFLCFSRPGGPERRECGGREGVKAEGCGKDAGRCREGRKEGVGRAQRPAFCFEAAATVGARHQRPGPAPCTSHRTARVPSPPVVQQAIDSASSEHSKSMAKHLAFSHFPYFPISRCLVGISWDSLLPGAPACLRMTTSDKLPCSAQALDCRDLR